MALSPSNEMQIAMIDYDSLSCLSMACGFSSMGVKSKSKSLADRPVPRRTPRCRESRSKTRPRNSAKFGQIWLGKNPDYSVVKNHVERLLA